MLVFARLGVNPPVPKLSHANAEKGVITQGDTWEELCANVKEAVADYFFDRTPPARVRLRLVRDEVWALA